MSKYRVGDHIRLDYGEYKGVGVVLGITSRFRSGNIYYDVRWVEEIAGRRGVLWTNFAEKSNVGLSTELLMKLEDIGPDNYEID